MGQEIELKLSVPDAGAAAALVRWLDGHAAASGDFPLRNVYLDTPQRDLARARAALRLRQQGTQWLQTLKTAGSSSGGLAVRQEWETPVAGEAIEPGRLPDIARDLLTPLLGRLAPVFRTDFHRRTWRMREGGAEIEVALDEGEIFAPGNGGRETIHELELEFLGGDPQGAAEALRALATRLAEVAPLQPSDRSKAARGYALADGVRDGGA